MTVDTELLAARAGDLLHLHQAPEPLVLPNVWDAESARLVADAGFPAVATSSSAIAASLGEADGERMSADAAFAAIGRIASAVELPVTADAEAGYGLEPIEFVDRLLEAGAVGCNLEDSDHHGPAVLRPTAEQAGRISAICQAAEKAGVPVVLNARVDVFIRQYGRSESRLQETLRRGRAYLAAGAACVYPIGVTDEGDIAQLVEGVGGPINIWLRPGVPSLSRLTELGVARVSLARGLQRSASAAVRTLLSELRRGDAERLSTESG